jgi:hypothetical protein
VHAAPSRGSESIPDSPGRKAGDDPGGLMVFFIVIAVYVILVAVVLPRLGVPT